MRMQEPEQRQSFETTGQEYSAYRVEAGDYEQQQKIYPQETLESQGSVTKTLTLIFCSIFSGLASVALIGSIIGLANTDRLQWNLLTGVILALAGSIAALLIFVTMSVLSIVSAARRAAHYWRSRLR